MATPEHVFYSAGLKAFGDSNHPDPEQRITLAPALYAVTMSDAFVPADHQADVNMSTISPFVWDGTFNNGQCYTETPLSVDPVENISYEIDAGQMKLIVPNLEFDISFGPVTNVGTANIGHVLIYVELLSVLTDADRFPLFSMRSVWEPVLAETFRFNTDALGSGVWKV